MDAKDLRTESGVSERNNDGSKYSQSGGIAIHCDRNKSYQEIGSNSLGKVDVPNARPCAVIGPDRVVPPPAVSESYHVKKGPGEPWPCMDNVYRRPPEYPHKLTNFQNPTRNISPRQTFQENMQRIMVPPTYNSIKTNDDTNYTQMSDRSNNLSKNIKLNMPQEAKFCDVPYAVNPPNNEHKNVRNPEMCLPSVNPTLTRTAPHGWSPGNVSLRSTRMFSTPELYQYQEYPSCAGPRPVVPRPNRAGPEEQGYVYADPYYQEGNIRFKPYPAVKDRYPQQRYEYIGNYSNTFYPPPGFPTHKYELQKSVPPHPFPPYTPIKYVDNRVAEPVMEGYQRNPQGNYNIQYRNQVIHPNYGPVVGNCPQNKLHSYPPDAHIKSMPPNKVPYDNSTKAYVEYENNRPKIYPPSESYFVNEMARMPMKNQVIMPNYPTINMHNIPPNAYYKRDNPQIKNLDHMANFRNMDPNLNIQNPMLRHAPVFSPGTLAISPTDSNTSNDTTQTHGTSQEDCGYISQSSTASARSIDSGINRIPNEYLRRYYDNRYGPIIRTSPMMSKSQMNSNNNTSKDKKQIDVRQFLQMWNEGDEEQEENGSKEIVIQTGSSDKNNFGKSQEAINSQEQLYVLGLVNVPSEELAKYEHIQKVSKLPENIKGYNSIELLHQFEEVIESSNMKNYKTPPSKEYHMSMKGVHQKPATGIIPPRPVSPLDVEAKISQSVIHKEVGCNFEIKPCSPKMLNVEIAAPIQNVLAERAIEKVANPVMLKSSMLNGINENMDCNIMKRTDHHMNMNENARIPSCKMINTQFSNNNAIDSVKSNYSIQDLESNSGLCLASLPRLDNDIELNFPEVNQQFINANKGENAVFTTSIRDLPVLEALDPSDNQAKDRFDNINPPRSENYLDRSPYNVDTEKEFSKLSQYRKTKTNSSKCKETPVQHNVNAIRTDSVIIKNPENTKNYEENVDFSMNLNKVAMDIQQTPINLTSQGSLSNNLENEPNNIDLRNVAKEKQLPAEIAIDFSLNKTAVLHSNETTETKLESQINTPMNIEEDLVITQINRDDSSTAVSLPPILTEDNENLTEMDNSDKIKPCDRSDQTQDSDDTSQANGEIDKKDNEEPNVSENSPRNESCEIFETELSKCATNSAQEVFLDENSTLLVSKIETSSNELLNKINSDDCEIDNFNNDASTIQELSEEREYTSTDINLEISINDKENFNEKGDYEMETAENTSNSSSVEDDFCKNNFADKLNSIDHIEPEQEINTPEVNEPTEIENDSIITEQTQLQNMHDEKLPLESEEMCGTDCASSDLIQSHSTTTINSESRTISKDYINHESDVDRPAELEENTDREDELMEFEKKYYDDSLEKLNECGNPPVHKIPEDLYKKPIRRNLRYESKEMYSPWIQKLLIYSEGNCKNVITEKDSKCSNSNEDFSAVEFIESKAITRTADSEAHHKDSNCDIETEKLVPEEEVFHEDVNEEQDNSNDAVNNTIDDTTVNTSSSLVLDHNIDEMVISDDHFKCEDNPLIEVFNNNDQSTEDKVDDFAAETICVPQMVSDEIDQNDLFDSIVVSEPDSNENIICDSEMRLSYDVQNQCEEPDTSNVDDVLCESIQEDCKEQSVDKNGAQDSSTLFEDIRVSYKGLHDNAVSSKKCERLKRSLSDSALNNLHNIDERLKQDNEENVQFVWPFKRRKINNVNNDLQNLCNIINHNRRNSVSSFYNEDNVSFCILIDNSCIIAEDESEDTGKVCYAELSEDCLTEIENNCMETDENVETSAEILLSPQQENACNYSDSFVLDCEEEKTLEESWVEDVGCVETVISDDIAEDIEICEPTSPKEDALSDNDESGVFSSNEHTDKVKFIYGDKMCSDDALFVETLYKTPQMDVNKTLYNRETHVSEECVRYYDNDSLEKMLSESNEREPSPYVPQYLESMFSGEQFISNEAPENKENVNTETFSQSKGNALDIVVDINVDKNERENTHSIEIFAKTGDDNIDSCESSVDNLFTYSQNDEDAIYTSSSPEVSSTTSEEKNSGILLKITNYKGSRISQINDISRVNKRSRCKFTEDKEYLHSHANYSSNRPLLTKAAQKYIPPLKESIRDLKVQLSLPQHSLMKLKQLKMSKDEPKLNKHSATTPPIPKKPKPKFEDVLKSIDEIQFKKHKEKSKKSTKKTIPKVVIKKSQNGSHYASTSNKDDFNPDMTGRKWQPWVFIEKNLFIDKMATKNKTQAIYSHRKRTYVLAEKFQKYKSASSAKFVISPPISDNPSSGLKYTIRLKHNY